METLDPAYKIGIAESGIYTLKGFDLLSAGSRLSHALLDSNSGGPAPCLKKLNAATADFSLSTLLVPAHRHPASTKSTQKIALVQQSFSATPDARLGAIDTELVCFLRKADLMAECVLSEPSGITDAGALYAIAQDRDCESFSPHIPGFSPMEHAEVYQMQRLEQDRREFEERLATRDAEVHTALVKAQQAFDLEREKSKEPTEKLMKRLTLFAVVLGCGQVVIGAVALTSDSLLVKAAVKLWRLIFG